LENVMLPLRVRRCAGADARQAAMVLLEQVGLAERFDHRPAALSGGERQRVAIARALITQPDCILADEPTGNLDDNAAQTVFDLMLQLNQTHQTALVVVTHDPSLAGQMDRVYRLHQGQIYENLSTKPFE